MKYLVATLFFLLFLNAETDFAKPKPSMDTPRQVVFAIVDGDEKSIHHVLSTANNILKFYGPENIELKIVAYSAGIKAVLKKETAFASRVDALMQYEVVFVACNNTMKTKKINPSELIDGVEIVTAGVVEIIERVKEGWIFIKP